MVSIAHAIGNLLPRGIRHRVRPIWHVFQTIQRFRRRGGRIRYSSELGSFWAEQPLPDKSGAMIAVAFRSVREFNRFANLFEDSNPNMVFRWLTKYGDCDTFWDVGSANGIEGFLVASMFPARVLLLEPYTPSIETILKSCYLAGMRGDDISRFEIVQGLASNKTSYGELVMHKPPKAGATTNAAADGLDNYTYLRNDGKAASIKQWLGCIALDDLHFEFGLPLPNLIKIDVDGYELKTMAGANKILKSGNVDCWIIEVFEANAPVIRDMMEDHGYAFVEEYDHHSGDGFVADYLFLKKSIVSG